MSEKTFRKEPTYIMSKPPTRPFLYHHANYSGLKLIANTWSIRAHPGKHKISLTTDPGRFLSPLPIIMTVTVSGVVKIPFNEELQRIAIPCLYVTHNVHLIDTAIRRGYNVFTAEQIPPEYKYIMKYVTHADVFIDENEYVVVADSINLPLNSVIYIHPAKLKRFKAGLGRYSMQDIRSLEDLAAEIEVG